MQFPIIIGLRRSFLLERSLLTVSLLAGLMLVMMDWPLYLRLLALGLCLFLFLQARRQWRRHSNQMLLIDRQGLAILRQRDGSEQTVRWLHGATVHPWLTVLRLQRADGQRQTLIFTVDNISAANFRRLRAVMCWQAAFADEADDV